MNELLARSKCMDLLEYDLAIPAVSGGATSSRRPRRIFAHQFLLYPIGFLECLLLLRETFAKLSLLPHEYCVPYTAGLWRSLQY